MKDELLRGHREYRYIYEVINRRSGDFQKVDYVFSDVMLHAGHLYLVRFNARMGYPRIQEVLAEFSREDYPKNAYLRGDRAPWEEDGFNQLADKSVDGESRYNEPRSFNDLCVGKGDRASCARELG